MTIQSSHHTVYENCLMPLLKALKWKGSDKSLAEARPYFGKVGTVTDYCDIFNYLRYDSRSVSVDLASFDKRLLPCLLVTDYGDVMVLLSAKNDQIKIHDGITNKELTLTTKKFCALAKNSRLYLFKERKVDGPEVNARSWFWATIRKNRGIFYNAIFLSFILNILVLATPIFVMNIYDKVISASSYGMLGQFSGGIALVLIAAFFIYRIRAEHLALIGVKCDKAIGDHIVGQLLHLAPHYTETATTGAQIARIKDFDRVREFFSGASLTVFFELPFIIIALVFIAFLASYLVLIPITMLVLYAFLGLSVSIRAQGALKKSSAAFANLGEFLLESIERIRVVKYTASIKSQISRYRDLSAKSNIAGMRLSIVDAISSAISEIIMIGSGMLVVAFGAMMVMRGKLSVGAMLAVMIIIWRILTPVKSIFNNLPRLIQLKNSIRQINRLMQIKPETEKMVRVRKGRVNFRGEISFERVSLRYPAAFHPALIGASFNIKAGSLIALLGPNGSGKSTIMKLILGLYQPQAGSILIDSCDIRQLNPLDLRNSIGYLPQISELFYGTIAENLRMGDPLASDEKLARVAEDLGILEEIRRLPAGFETKITDRSAHRMATTFRQMLCLARACLRDAAILLLDEPANGLDQEANARLMRYLGSLRGKVTVLVTTHQPSQFSDADSVILMKQGQIVVHGAPDEVLANVPQELL